MHDSQNQTKELEFCPVYSTVREFDDDKTSTGASITAEFTDMPPSSGHI